MLYRNTGSNLNDYINKWNQLNLKIENLNQDKLNLEILINNQKIFKGEIANNQCNEIKVGFGITEHIKVSNAKFHQISFKNFKLVSGPITKCDFIKNSEKKFKIMLVGDSQIDNGNNYKCNILASELSYNLNNAIDVFVKGGSGYVSKDIDIKKSKNFKQLTKKKDLSTYDWVIWISGADLNSFREAKDDLLIKRVDKIISKNLKSGYLIDTLNFSQNKDTKFIISLTNEMSENLKTKKYMKLINSGQKLIKRYREVANKYENVFFLPIQDHIDKDNETLYTDKYDGVHYSNKGMQILAQPLSEIIKKD
jgi:lysophospholipase L1-like esterase